MKHAITETNNGSRLIDAQGHLIKTADADRRLLHVLPKLYVDAPILHRFMRPEHVRLSVTADQPELNHLQPSGGSIQVTQCVPNKGYFIGGCLDTRYGWFVRLPDDLDVIDLVFHWDIAVPAAHLRQRIEHEISLNLLSGPYNTWSMDLSAWHRVRLFEPGKPPLVFQPTTLLSGAGFDEGRNVEVIDILIGDESEDGDLFVYVESLEIPAIPFSDLAYIEEFQDRQLHEISRQAIFTRNNDAHRENAAIEMPEEVFVSAVRTARDVSFGKDTEYFKGHCADHPAMKILSDWWNDHAPEHRCAAFAMPWVRVEEDAEEYWCGYYETPNEPFTSFVRDKAASARVGDAVLIQFMRQITEQDARPYGIDVFLVNENLAQTVGVDIEDLKSGEYDEAWYSLEALSRFPGRFPEVWGALVEETITC
ncbi:hypothetical protein C3R74_11215 [Acidithiobacillus ferridurans]|uniref:hypothetical protein n=2 Tax=Acidithiobacillus ferridurans TaxID=1232575 RepID=UPI000DE1B383|nr:hypothetical protein [Acidithiobacillus ferridurans]RBL99083.1 hypothetical protein C3R74_11215 [Acidithiobacillus ferridurans]